MRDGNWALMPALSRSAIIRMRVDALAGDEGGDGYLVLPASS